MTRCPSCLAPVRADVAPGATFRCECGYVRMMIEPGDPRMESLMYERIPGSVDGVAYTVTLREPYRLDGERSFGEPSMGAVLGTMALVR